MKKFLWLAVSLFLLAPHEASALDISPLRITHNLRPGTTHRDSLVVTNPGNEIVHITVKPAQYRSLKSPNAQLPADPYAQIIPSCAEWIKVEAENFVVMPNQSTAVFYSVTLPKNWNRESAASLVFDRTKNISPEENFQGSIELVSRFSIPVFLSAEGHNTLEAEAMIGSIKRTERPGFIEVQSLLMNTGGRHFRAIGTLAVFSNDTGRLVAERPTGRTLPVFAGHGERLKTTLPAPDEGSYFATLTVDLGEDKIIQDKFLFRVSSTGKIKRDENPS